jgi:hypothetical protein
MSRGNEQFWNFYYYQIVREKLDSSLERVIDEWRIYVTKASGDKHIRELAEQHLGALNAELTDDGKKEIPWRKQWQLHAYSKFDMSRINQGLPVQVASFDIPVVEEYGRSDVNNA